MSLNPTPGRTVLYFVGAELALLLTTDWSATSNTAQDRTLRYVAETYYFLGPSVLNNSTTQFVSSLVPAAFQLAFSSSVLSDLNLFLQTEFVQRANPNLKVGKILWTSNISMKPEFKIVL